jgi:23S rRNA (guanosine2251-2'-O)-methyltransferase
VSDPDRRVSPKDAFITVYGRKPVLEALGDPALSVDKVVLAEGTSGPAARPVLDAAAARGVPVHRASAHRVKVLAGNGRQDQGVLADVVAPRMRPLEHFLADLPTGAGGRVLVLDGLTNPTNVGMILRSATAAGLDGVLLPRRGVPSIDPLVVKASAGVAFRAPVLRAGTAAAGLAALGEAGFALFGLDGTASGTRRPDRRRPRRAARHPRDPAGRRRRVAQRRVRRDAGVLRAGAAPGPLALRPAPTERPPGHDPAT